MTVACRSKRRRVMGLYSVVLVFSVWFFNGHWALSWCCPQTACSGFTTIVLLTSIHWYLPALSSATWLPSPWGLWAEMQSWHRRGSQLWFCDWIFLISVSSQMPSHHSCQIPDQLGQINATSAGFSESLARHILCLYFLLAFTSQPCPFTTQRLRSPFWVSQPKLLISFAQEVILWRKLKCTFEDTQYDFLISH